MAISTGTIGLRQWLKGTDDESGYITELTNTPQTERR